MACLSIEERDCDLENCCTAVGLTKQNVWRLGPLEVEIQQMGCRFDVKGSFLGGLPAGLILLGRQDFFAQFKVEVDERAQAFSLDPYA